MGGGSGYLVFSTGNITGLVLSAVIITGICGRRYYSVVWHSSDGHITSCSIRQISIYFILFFIYLISISSKFRYVLNRPQISQIWFWNVVGSDFDRCGRPCRYQFSQYFMTLRSIAILQHVPCQTLTFTFQAFSAWDQKSIKHLICSSIRFLDLLVLVFCFQKKKRRFGDHLQNPVGANIVSEIDPMAPKEPTKIIRLQHLWRNPVFTKPW